MKRFSFSEMSHKQLILGLISLSFIFLMFGNGIISLTHPDEVFYAETSKEMITHNSWLVPYIFDEPQFEKPILFYVLLKIALQLFGISYFWARFWPAFFGMLGVLISYWIAWIMFQSKRLSFLAGMVLSTSFIYIALSRAILTDMMFSIIVAISIGFLYTSYFRKDKKSLGLILGFVFSGIAVLTKGALGFCFPFGAFLLFLLWRRDLGFLKCLAAFWGFLSFLAIALPWHIYMYQLFGQKFIDVYWHNVHVSRLFDAEHQKCNSWFFYPVIMLGGVMPWSFFLIPAIAEFTKDFKKNAVHQMQAQFLLCWIIGVFIFVQPAASKLASYIFPVFPALAIILGYYFTKMIDSVKPVKTRYFCIAGYLFSGFALIASVLCIVFARKYIGVVIDMVPVYVFSTLIAICAGAIIFLLKKRKFQAVVFTNCGITIALLTTLFMGRSYAEPWVSCKLISDRFLEIDQSSTTVLASKLYVRGVRFYTDRDMAVIDINGKGFFTAHEIPFLNTDQKVLDFLASQKVTFGVVKEGNVRDLERICKKGDYQMKHYENIGGKFIVRISK